jgi:prephenate dehydrogenase
MRLLKSVINASNFDFFVGGHPLFGDHLLSGVAKLSLESNQGSANSGMSVVRQPCRAT